MVASKGGAQVLAALQGVDLSAVPMSSLFVPAGLTFLGWHRKNSSGQRGGGGPVPAANAMLLAWLGVTGQAQLTATTLVPVGILVLLYNAFAGTAGLSRQQRGGGSSRLEDHPLVRQLGGSLVTPQTLAPFALLLGRDVHAAAAEG